MASSGMLHHVALLRTDVLEELTKATRLNIPEDSILHSHCRENHQILPIDWLDSVAET
jgi:carbonic anhydrase/acetyltransferase-like protein (isoleucine patch superfamily)